MTEQPKRWLPKFEIDNSNPWKGQEKLRDSILEQLIIEADSPEDLMATCAQRHIPITRKQAEEAMSKRGTT